MPLSLYARDSGLADASVDLPRELIGGWISAGSALGLAGFTIWMFRWRTRRPRRLRPDRL